MILAVLVIMFFYVSNNWNYSSSDETEDEDANDEYIDDTNKDSAMIAASKLVLADAVSKVCAAFFNPLIDHQVVLLTATLLSADYFLFHRLGHIEMSFQQTTEVSTFPLLQDYLGPEIVSHYVSHGASTTEIIKHLITSLRKNGNFDMGALFSEALRRVTYLKHV
jgi:cohesin complex subunit SA-1/2